MHDPTGFMAEAFQQLGDGARDGMKTAASATEDVATSWSKLRDDNDPTTWFLTTHDGKKTYSLLGEGQEISALIEALRGQESHIHFGGIRAIVDGTPRFFHLLVVGSSVGMVKRNKAPMLKNAPFNVMEGGGGDIEFGHEEVFDAPSLVEKISALTGTNMIEI